MQINQTIFLASLVSISALFGCNGKKEITPLDGGGKEIILYCSGPDYQTNGKTFRASGFETSEKMNFALDQAKERARQELATSIKQTVKVVSERYQNENEIGNSSETIEQWESKVQSIVDQVVVGTPLICERIVKADNKFTAYCAVEMASSDLLQGLSSRLSNEQRELIDTRSAAFTEVFNQVMAEQE